MAGKSPLLTARSRETSLLKRDAPPRESFLRHLEREPQIHFCLEARLLHTGSERCFLGQTHCSEKKRSLRLVLEQMRGGRLRAIHFRSFQTAPRKTSRQSLPTPKGKRQVDRRMRRRWPQRFPHFGERSLPPSAAFPAEKTKYAGFGAGSRRGHRKSRLPPCHDRNCGKLPLRTRQSPPNPRERLTPSQTVQSMLPPGSSPAAGASVFCS